MKKLLQVLLLAVMLMPFIAQAQTTTPATLPYSCSFEDASENANWTLVSGASANKFFIGTAVNNGGTQSLYVSNTADGSSFAYSSSGTKWCYAYREISVTTASSYIFSFDWRCVGEHTSYGVYDYGRVFLVPETDTLQVYHDGDYSGPMGISSTYGPAGWIAVDNNVPLAGESTWQTFVSDEITIPVGTWKLVYLFKNDSYGGDDSPLAVDNVAVMEVLCPRPSGISLADISSTSATIAWNRGGVTSFNYEYVVDGTSRTYITTSVSDSVVTLDNLTPNTSYTFYLQAVCGTDTTFWSSMTFRTSCAPYALSTLPMTEGFESWNNISYDPCYVASYSSTTSHLYPSISNYEVSTGSNAVELYAPSTGYCWFALPAFEADLNQLQVRFDCNIYSYQLIVGAMSNPNDINTLDTIIIFDNNDGVYHTYTLPLSLYQGTNKYLAFVVHGANGNRGDVYLDNITMELLPACPDPMNFAVVATGSESAMVAYSATSDIAEYIIEYDTAGYTLGNVNAQRVTSIYGDTTYITGLDPDTRYDFYIRSDCGNDTGNWVGPITIRTACAPIADIDLPYTESFDTWENINSNPCYKTNDYPKPSISTSEAYDGTKSLYLSAGTYYESWFSMPVFETEMNLLQVTFSMKKTNAGSEYPVLVGLTSDPTSLDDFETIASVRCYSANVWERRMVSFTSYQGTKQYITFVSPYGVESYNYIDSIVVEYASTCTDPINLAAVATSSTSAKINYTNTGSYGVDVMYGVHGFDLSNGTIVSSTIDSVEIDNLVANTSYDFYVRANCGSEVGNWMGPLTVRTHCAEFVDISDNPFIEDFDSYTTDVAYNSSTPGAYPNHTMPQCWNFLNMSSSSGAYPQAFISSAEDYATYGNCLFIKGSDTKNLHVTLPRFNESINLLRIAFSTKFEDANRGRLVLGVMTDVDVDSTFIPLDTIPSSTSKVRHEYLFSQSDLYGTDYSIVLRFGETNNWYLGIDSIVVDLAPTCSRPENIAAIDSTITQTSAEITWTSSATSWILEYGLEGFVPGTGTMVVANTNPFTLTGLTHSTRYNVYVRAVCGNDTSEYSMTPGSFQTACDVVTTLPWNANLDGYYDVYYHTNTYNAAPTCWQLINGGDTYSWRYSESESDIRTGTRALYFYGSTYSSTVNDDWLITPELQLTGNEQLTFWMRNVSDAEADVYSANMKVYYYIVDANIDTLNTASFVQIGDSIRKSGAGANQWDEYIIPLTGVSGNVRLAFVVNSSSYTFCIDDVTVEAMPSCPRPRNIVFSNIQASQADVAWTSNGDTYTIAYGVSGFDITDASTYQTITSNTNSATITGLLANTMYDVYVVANCSNPTATSQWSYVKSFRSACGAVTVPFNENFNSYTDIGSGSGSPSTYPNHEMPACWNFLNMSASNYPRMFITTNMSGYAVDGNCLFFQSSSSTAAYAVLPPVNVSIDSLRIKFTYRNEGVSTANGRLSLGVMTDPNNANSFIELETYDQVSTLTNITHDFWIDSIIGTGYQIAFRYTGGNTNNYYLSIDNVVVDYAPICRASESLVASNITSSSADLAWVNGTGDSYIVAYSVDRNFNPDTCTTVVTSNTENVTISGLQTFTTYYYAVKAVCNGDSSEWSLTSNFKTILDCGANTYNIVELTTGTSSASALPFYASANYYPKAKSWQIVTAQEMEMEGMYAGNIYSVGFQYDGGSPISPDVRVYLANTTLATMGTADTLGASQMTLVYEGPASFSNGSTWSVINFTTPFAYTGGNVMLAVERTTNLSASGSFKYDPGVSGVNRSVYKYDGSWSSSIYPSAYRNNLRFEGCTTIPSCPRPSDVVISNIQPTQVDVAWTSNGTSFAIAYGPHGFSMDSVNAYQIANSTTNSTTLTGLTEGMRYDIYVRAICSATETSEWSYMTTFITTCSAVAVPYSEDFNGYTENVSSNNSAHSSYPYHSLPSCWTFINMSDNSGAQPQAYLSSSLYYSADTTNFMILSSEYGKTIYAALPKFNDPISSLYLSMKYRTYSANETYNGKPEIGVMTDLGDTSTFILLETLPTTATFTTAEHYFSIDSLQGNNYNIVIRYRATPDGYSSYSAMFDDIVVDIAPDCIRPLNLAVDSVGQTSVSLSWRNANATSNFVVEYKKAADTVWTAINGITSTTSTINNLSPATEYNFRVKSFCSATEEGGYSNVVSATTLCGAIQLPFFEDFSNSSFPYNCWSKFSGSYTSPISSTSSGWGHTTNTNGLPTSHVKFNIYSSYTYGFATPEIDLTNVADAELTFDLALTGFNSADAAAQSGDDRFIVAISVDGGATWADTNAVIWGRDSATCQYMYDSITNTGITATISLRQYAGNVIKLAFWGSSTTSGTDNDLHIDNISVVAISSCDAPVITDVVATHNEATVSWTSMATDFQVVYKGMNDAEWIDTIDVTNATTYTITGLTHETGYIVAVRALCGVENSMWTESTFTTTEIPCLAPTNVVASNITYTSATIAWEAAGNEVSWEVRYAVAGIDTTIVAETNPVVLENLYSGDEYQVWVRAFCGMGTYSDWSEVYTFSTVACEVPSNVTASDINPDAATISWTSTAQRWEISYGFEGVNEENGTKVTVEDTPSYTIEGLEHGTTYDVYVRAICEEGVYSAWSSRTQFTTPIIGINTASNDNVDVRIYPNPANTQATVTVEGISGKVEFVVADMNGRMMMTETITCEGSLVKSIDVSNLAKGAYFVHIYNDNFNTTRKLIVK